MKKLILCLLVLSLLMACACRKYDDIIQAEYTYAGKSECWSGTFKLEVLQKFYTEDGVLKFDGEANGVLTLKYKGESSDFTNVKHASIEYGSAQLGTSKQTETSTGQHNFVPFGLDSTTELTFNFSRTDLSNFAGPDEVVNVTINIDGDEQALELKTTP